VERVVVFLDYQNVYHGARRTFFDNRGPASCGHVNPFNLGSLIASRGPAGSDRVCTQVRVYRGVPDATRESTSHAASRRQIAAQRQVDTATEAAVFEKLRSEYRYEWYDLVHHELRTLRYPRNWPQEPAQEKGIDVQLAVDFVRGALAGWFDVGIIMSTDTDLRPALEAVLDFGIDQSWPYMLPPEVDPEDPDSVDPYFVSAELIDSASRPRVEVAAWGTPRGHHPRLSLADTDPFPIDYTKMIFRDETGEYVSRGAEEVRRMAGESRSRRRKLWCHWLDRDDYDVVADLTNYTRD